MSRLESQMKGGFYPAPDFAIDEVVARLDVLAGTSERTCILDPCCGEGEAIARLALKLGIPKEDVYAAELEEHRSMVMASRLLGGNVLGLCDFTTAIVSSSGFGLIWLNPPFDDEIGGGGRVELDFLRRATQLLVRGGVIAFVAPEKTVSNYDVKDHLMSHYDHVSVMPFPVECRFHKEVIVLGVRRNGFVKANPNDWHQHCYANRARRYAVPPASGPKRFERGGLSEGEIMELLADSPLNVVFAAPPELKPGEPPLELGKGQQALCLSGGMLDGVVELPGEPPVMVKSTPFKENYIRSEEEEERGTGDDAEVVIVRVTAQRIKLKVRVLTVDGRIKDLV